MYRHISNQSGDKSETLVIAFLQERGWIPSVPQSRDAVYDLIVDLGNKNFQTIQVKTMKRNGIPKRRKRDFENVSKNGKTRNTINYADHKIDWIIGVHKDGSIYPYKLENYKNISPDVFSVRKYKCDEFPVNIPDSHLKKPLDT